jgi:hypothetical protein
MSNLHDAIAAIDHALRLEAGRMDLYGGYDITGCEAGYTFMATKGLNQEVAFAQAETLEETLVLLAGRLVEAGYGAVAAR